MFWVVKLLARTAWELPMQTLLVCLLTFVCTWAAAGVWNGTNFTAGH